MTVQELKKLISDGENTDRHKLDSFADISEDIEGGAVMGYGTDKGGQMHYYDELYDEVVLVEDKRDFPYTPAISCIDEDNLEQLADDLGVEYVHMDRQDRIDPILDDLVKYLDAEEEATGEAAIRLQDAADQISNRNFRR